MKIYCVMIEDGGWNDRAYCTKKFTTRAKAKNHIEHLKKTRYKNYFVRMWVTTEEIE